MTVALENECTCMIYNTKQENSCTSTSTQSFSHSDLKCWSAVLKINILFFDLRNTDDSMLCNTCLDANSNYLETYKGCPCKQCLPFYSVSP